MSMCRIIGLLAAFVASSPSLGQQPASMPPERSAEVFGQKIRYYEAGQGPALIFIHGTGANAERWARNIAPFSKQFHVYALDQIGFGHSDKPLLDYHVDTFVDFLKEFMRVINVPKATLVGNSFGGAIAAKFTIEHPESVDRLVLVDAAGLAPFATPDELPRKPPDWSFSSIAATRGLIEMAYYNKKMVTDDLVRRVFQGHMQINDAFTIQRVVANRSADYIPIEKVQSIHAPTLVVWGRQDEIIPVAAGEKYHDAIVNSQLSIIDECGHLPEAEKPEQFNTSVLEFLNKQH